MTPTEIISKAHDRLRAATLPVIVDTAQDMGLGAIGALRDLGLITIHEYRAAFEDLEALAEQVKKDLAAA